LLNFFGRGFGRQDGGRTLRRSRLESGRYKRRGGRLSRAPAFGPPGGLRDSAASEEDPPGDPCPASQVRGGLGGNRIDSEKSVSQTKAGGWFRAPGVKRAAAPPENYRAPGPSTGEEWLSPGREGRGDKRLRAGAFKVLGATAGEAAGQSRTPPAKQHTKL
ncbi:hypothetical protein NDU88_007877, partial [Pleurodeles waltl]